ncbi:metal-dependent hydrolase [Pseudomonas sp.]|uniref:metal-dependent hydrolase n=1 Tax=Pseudomonas sp. TaxID=306 RepID=UPI002BA9DEAC|nr:metal-dependent hydrolase [Pseudomonas sp.]HUE94117.1 metal-dependent hydrolase [Pseudomonas sp.]
MFIGHLPAGYITAKLLLKKFANTGITTRFFILAAVLGAIAPDFDMFYFYLLDNRQNHHHTYWPHYPALWLTMLAASSVWFKLASKKSYAALALIFSISGFIHMLLDSIVGDIWWFAPLIDQPYALFTVEAVYKPWWLNFILHWSFALEILMFTWAIYLWHFKPSTSRNAPT